MKTKWYPFDIVLTYNLDQFEAADWMCTNWDNHGFTSQDLYLDGDQRKLVHYIRVKSRLSWNWYQNMVRSMYRKMQQVVIWVFLHCKPTKIGQIS